ncbi:MAG: hypothetical protein AAFY56_16890, partial [Pseudomonadota bacterium]
MILRRYLSLAMRGAHDLTKGWIEQAGLFVRENAAGSLIGLRHGGRYDGVLGVLADIEAGYTLQSHDLALEIVA